MAHELKRIAGDLRSDGTLRDFYIRDANRMDWDAVLKRVSRNWQPHRFSVNGEAQELPLSFEMIERLRASANACLGVQVADAFVNCHFFWDGEIEFEFRPEDFRTAERWAALCGFFQDMVDAVGKSGIVTHECRQYAVIDRFEPRLRAQ